MTRKPCPGCNGNKPHRSVNSVCSDCASLIAEAKAHRESLERKKLLEPAKLPFADYCLPRLHHLSDSKPVQKFVFDLVELVGQRSTWSGVSFPPAEQGDYGYIIAGESGCSSSGATYWLVPRGLSKLLNSLFASLDKLGAETYNEAHREGQSLLRNLATGETSIDEFNEITAGPIAKVNNRRFKRRYSK